MALGAAASWARYLATGTLRIDTGSAAFILSSLALGAGLAVACTCALRLQRDARWLEPRALLASSLVAHLCAFPALALTSSDLFSYLAYGRLQLAGLNPHLSGPRALASDPVTALVAPRWLDARSNYGPLADLASRLAARAGETFGSPVWVAGFSFKLLMLLSSLGVVLLAWGHARRRGADGADAFALVALSPLLAWEVSGQGHNDGLVVLALMGFVWAASAGRELAASLALAAGVAVKIAVAPLLALYLLFVARRSPTRAAALGLAAAALGAVAFLPYWQGTAPLREWALGLGHYRAIHAHSLADLLALALARTSPETQAMTQRACALGSTLLFAGLFARAALRATELPRLFGDALGLYLAWCLTTPWFQPWYATWLLPLGAADPDPRRRRLIALYGVISVVQWAVPLDPVTTVAGNAFIAWQWLRPRKPVAKDVPAASAA